MWERDLHDAGQHEGLQRGPANECADSADRLEEGGAQRGVAVVEEGDQKRQQHVVGVLTGGKERSLRVG